MTNEYYFLKIQPSSRCYASSPCESSIMFIVDPTEKACPKFPCGVIGVSFRTYQSLARQLYRSRRLCRRSLRSLQESHTLLPTCTHQQADCITSTSPTTQPSSSPRHRLIVELHPNPSTFVTQNLDNSPPTRIHHPRRPANNHSQTIPYTRRPRFSNRGGKIRTASKEGIRGPLAPATSLLPLLKPTIVVLGSSRRSATGGPRLVHAHPEIRISHRGREFARADVFR